ncbi:hypothetical protein [Curvivirga aplysinae]|uniref:hypothetical protein n=1 Tax=Curvivirga aplysinae TaxID=2529852 RepID=UPI0012BB63BC|nr:hypothetical protein [Curvivirga aplysinae]MTI11294.1 peptidoglycan-binding protein [Curvivirga aplysinae]
MNKNTFSLNSTLAKDSPADPEDTLNVKRKLHKSGFMDMPSYGLDDMPDQPMFDGIKKFQAAKKLKVDGVMKPGGETEKSMQSHPGKPGPDLPVVMPGPGEGQDENCTEIIHRLQRSYELKKELDFKTLGLKSKAEANISQAKSVRELAGLASEADVGLKAAAGLIGSELLKKLSMVMGEFANRATKLGLMLAIADAILTETGVINNDIDSYRRQLSDVESDIVELTNKAMQLGCKL